MKHLLVQELDWPKWMLWTISHDIGRDSPNSIEDNNSRLRRSSSVRSATLWFYSRKALDIIIDHALATMASEIEKRGVRWI
jgi:hypothetical protein